MKYIKFEIKNFKGIKDLTLDFTKNPRGNISPLVGLNESGKTTILEAINWLHKDLKDKEQHTLIHKRDKGDFTGSISIKATLKCNDNDRNHIDNFMSSINLELQSPVDFIIISREYFFKNSSFSKKESSWLISLINKTVGLQVKHNEEKEYTSLYKKNNASWTNFLKDVKDNLLPKILFFPDFIFKFPEKIYLTKNNNTSYSGEEEDRQDEYRLIINDILLSIDSNYSVSKLNDKLKNRSSETSTSAKQILVQVKNALNNKILSKWDEIFPNTPKKSIEISYDTYNESIYLELSISEGNSSFTIDERSLGFRWFFGFILFTEFRQEREGEKETIFLFDEPANNLHQKSQQQLLSLLDNIAKKSKIVYSTHSHYLLNSKLILNTFIVNDKGKSIDDDYSYRQDIKATPYKEFCSNGQNDTTHFQPILDVLDYVENPFEKTNNIVFFEGKNDYYTFKWIYNACLKLKYNFNFYPGAGVDKYENIFREYLAHNRNFIAIFDADGDNKDKGKGAKKRYIENISQELESKVFTLEDVDIKFDGFTTEALFTDSEKLNIQKQVFPDLEEYKKSKFNTSIQALFIQEKYFELTDDTKKNFEDIFSFIKNKL